MILGLEGFEVFFFFQLVEEEKNGERGEQTVGEEKKRGKGKGIFGDKGISWRVF